MRLLHRSYRYPATFPGGSLQSFCRSLLFSMLVAVGALPIVAQTSAAVRMSAKPMESTPTWTESILYSFSNGSDGAVSYYGNLALASDGNFYGAAQSGGAGGVGTLYKVAPDGTFTLLYTFTGRDGSIPDSGLVEGSDGNLYGTTLLGGANNAGTVFQLTPAGTLNTLYSFCSQGGSGCTDGAYPSASLIQGKDGSFYGTTSGSYSSNPNGGTVFKITPSGMLTTLYTFCLPAGCANGTYPQGGLVQGSDGNFYGTTFPGGGNRAGTIFSISPSGDFQTIYSFSGADGQFPNATLTEGPDGNFYGTTLIGGATYNGTIFKVTPSGSLTSLYSFTGGSDGGNPYAPMYLASDGNFYSTAEDDGQYYGGTVFQMTPSGTVSTIYQFCQDGDTCADGLGPLGGLIQGIDGNLYGGTGLGGIYTYGALYKLAELPALPSPVQLSVSSGTVTLGEPFTLRWSVSNAFSTTMQQCNAFVNSPETGGGNWTGSQAGALSNGVYSGSAIITPTAVGTYTYALTCGGIESGFASVTVTSEGVPNITFTATPNPVTIGQKTILQATMSGTGPTPTGTLAFLAGGPPLAVTRLQNGTSSYTLDTSSYAAGSLTLTADYGGDSNYSSTSAKTTLILNNPIPTATSLTILPSNPIACGSLIQLQVNVSQTGGSGLPSGTATIYAGNTALATISIVLGQGTLIYSSKGILPGAYPITAVYSGDSMRSGSTSNPVSVQFVKAATETILYASSTTVKKLGSITLKAVVYPPQGNPIPTGIVTFTYAGGPPVRHFQVKHLLRDKKQPEERLAPQTAEVEINELGVATITVSTAEIPSGTYSVTATYQGDGENSPSTSQPIAITLQ